MSWVSDCYQIYDLNSSEIGRQEAGRVPLLPIAHTTQKVNVEVELDDRGNFIFAHLLAPEEQTTIIPCTEKSSARSGKLLAPHPLVDKLQYIASDYKERGGKKESGWNLYQAQLHEWCASPFAVPAVQVVLDYLEKGTLISDLTCNHILFTDANGNLPSVWKGSKEATPKVISTLTGGDQTESVVRFRVGDIDLSRSEAVRNSYIQYFLSTLKKQDYCTVQGQWMPVSSANPYKIRNAGDRAKLISSNDSSNFTYRGRFYNADQALSIGYETTQKAHSALRWLISKQGHVQGDQAIVAWGTRNESVPDVTVSSLDLLFCSGLSEERVISCTSTNETFAREFGKAIAGYRHHLTEQSSAVVMVLDSATSGRLSIRYYRKISGSQLMKNIEDWHSHFRWMLRYQKIFPAGHELGQNPKAIPVTFLGAPSPADIAKAAYGENVDDKLKQQTIERLLPCISEGRPFPYDLMLSAVNRATASIGLEPWEREKTSSIACALVCGYHYRNSNHKEDFSMALDETCNDRSYLFGRILACADQIERHAQMIYGSEDSSRPTNAARLRVSFVHHPAKTTMILQEQLMPYLNRLKANGTPSVHESTMNDLIARLGVEGMSNKPLEELYLVGYASQMMAFQEKNEKYRAAHPTEAKD